MYEPRNYRHLIPDKGLVSFNVIVKETDLYIRASHNLKRKALKLTQKYRDILEKYIENNPAFLTSLNPLVFEKNAPLIVKAMLDASFKAGVGPMASVAGAIAEFIGRELSVYSPEIIVENGGDIYLKSLSNRLIGIYAGGSPFTGKIGLEVKGSDTPIGICTSSGTVGHSLSLGKADAVIVVSNSTALADAAATAIGNLVSREEDIPRGIEFAQDIEGLKGLVIIKDDKMQLWGDIMISQIEG